MIWSRYTHQFRNEDKYFLYNSLSNSLAELCEQTYYTVELGRLNNTLDSLDEETISQLQTMKVIVDNDDDEINKVRYVNMLRRQNNRRLILTINPTLACNFNCPYCFETTHPNTYMSDKVEEDIIQYISSNNAVKAIDVTWFGGEPLLAFDRIKSLTSKMKNLGLAYTASMITNGYLLTQDVIKELPSLSIRSLQITIDGMTDLHDSRRCLKSGKPTFERIVKNIDALQAQLPEIGVSIRVNVDETNQDDFVELYHYLSDKHYPNAQLSLAFVKDLSSCKSCENLCNRENQAKYIKYVQQKYGIGGAFTYPTSDRYECAIRNRNAIVIGPEGEIYKCWNDVGDKKKVVGNIDGKITNETLLLRYLIGADPFEDDRCQKCILLPVCGGGCPLSRIQNKFEGKDVNSCPLIIEHLDDFLLTHAIYKESTKETKN